MEDSTGYRTKLRGIQAKVGVAFHLTARGPGNQPEASTLGRMLSPTLVLLDCSAAPSYLYTHPA